jgi:hypothetical protein
MRGIMVLNGPAVQAAAPSERFQTIGHEMVHLLLGSLSEGRVHVPYWLHEGLAQLVMGEARHAGSIRLAWANIRNARIPMVDLIRDFPYGEASAPLAYAQCASFAQFVATEHFQFNSARDWFLYLVGRPEKAREIFVWATSARNVREQEATWGPQTRGHMNWIVIITSSTLLWAGIVVLFLVAYRAKRGRESTVMEDWDPWEREDEP